MTIETKYNIGDEVWFQDHGQPLSREIIGIETEIYAKKVLLSTFSVKMVLLMKYMNKTFSPPKKNC